MRRQKRGSFHQRVLQLIGAQANLLSASICMADGESAQLAANHVRDVKVRAAEGESGATEIEVVGTSSPIDNMRVEVGGKRLVMDISNADVAGAKESITTAVGVVGGVMTQAFKT